jgi:hypothetical protein
MSIGDRIAHAWNAFFNIEQPLNQIYGHGSLTYGSARPDRNRTFLGNERTIISSIYNRLGIDAAAVDLFHVRLDENNRYLSDIDSGLNNCLTVEANVDQAARAFRQDIVQTMFDKGCVAVVPVDTTINPELSGSFDIKTMRVGCIVGWYPQHVRVDLYDERDGLRKEITIEKSVVAIVENPLYTVMNETNSTLQRLVRKLHLLDQMDDMASSGKLDMIVQLPYVIKSPARRADADRRRKEIEDQLRGSKYGIAYTDGTEKITQLNRPIENNLLAQIQYLTDKLYAELGLTPEVMNGTADEPTMKNYYNRTIDPIITSVVEAMRRTFLTRTARTQGQSIMAFTNPFKMVPLKEVAEIADVFSRNEILAPNEIRQAIGFKPSSDPKADTLTNSNMPQQSQLPPAPNVPTIDGQLVDNTVNDGGNVAQPQQTGSVGARKSTTR